MKANRIFILMLSLLLCLSVFTACNNDSQGASDSDTVVYYTVKFNSNGGTEIEPKLVAAGGTVDEPPVPVRDGYIFNGWYDGSRRWSFYSAVKKDMTLTANWIYPEALYEHTPSDDGETTVITRLKKNEEELILPSYMGGYRVTAIADSVFSGLSSESVNKIVIPDTVVSIGEEAFMNSADIEIVIEGELSYIGEKAFYGCTGLTSVKLGGGITAVSAEAFVGSGLVSIAFPESLKVIDENAFSECLSLEKVFLYDSIESVNDSAFLDTAVQVVYFYGDEDNIADVLDSRVFAKNDKLLDAKIYIYSETETDAETEFDGFWYFNDNGQTRIW